MIDQNERKQLRQLIQSPQWGALMHLVQEFCDKIEDESTVRDSEWETLRATISNEAEVRGIQKLMQEVMVQINYGENRQPAFREPHELLRDDDTGM